MAVSKEQKLKAGLRKATSERNAVRLEIAALQEKERKLGGKVMDLLEQLGVTKTTEVLPNLDGYRLDRPEKMVVNEENLSAKLKAVAPKVHKVVFEKVIKFNRKAFEEAVSAGDIPDVDDILQDEGMVKFEAMSPRLMPTKALKSKDD